MKLFKYFNLFLFAFGQEDYDDYDDNDDGTPSDPAFALGQKGIITQIVTFEMSVNNGKTLHKSSRLNAV